MLKPPVYPLISSNSPAKYKPLIFLLSMVFGLISFRWTPPPVTKDFSNGNVRTMVIEKPLIKEASAANCSGEAFQQPAHAGLVAAKRRSSSAQAKSQLKHSAIVSSKPQTESILGSRLHEILLADNPEQPLRVVAFSILDLRRRNSAKQLDQIIQSG